MLRNSLNLQSILDTITPIALVSTTDATPIVVTATAHGFVTGDRVIITGHTTNTNANGTFYVTKVNANSFSLDGSTGTGGGAGGTDGFVYTAPKIFPVESFRHIFLTFATSGTATMTAKIVGTMEENDSTPDFATAQDLDNEWDNLQIFDLQDHAGINGDTGIAWSGADATRQVEVNTNIISLVTVIITAWTQGAISVNAKAISDQYAT